MNITVEELEEILALYTMYRHAMSRGWEQKRCHYVARLKEKLNLSDVDTISLLNNVSKLVLKDGHR